MRLRHDWYAWEDDFVVGGLERCRRHLDEVRAQDPKTRITIRHGVDNAGQPYVAFDRMTYGHWKDRALKRRIARG